MIAAATGGGKSSLAAQFAIHAAVESQCPALIFSFEMREVAVMKRAIYSLAMVDRYDIRNRTATHADFQRVLTESARLAGSNLWIDNSSGMSMAQVAAKARRMHKENGIRFLVIDQMSLVTPPGGKDTREREVAEINLASKNLAKELEIPVVGICQLNRERGMRESDSPAHNADHVIKIDPRCTDAELLTLDPIPVRLIVPKQRDGRKGVVDLQFHQRFTRFFEEAPEHTDGSYRMPYKE